MPYDNNRCAICGQSLLNKAIQFSDGLVCPSCFFGCGLPWDEFAYKSVSLAGVRQAMEARENKIALERSLKEIEDKEQADRARMKQKKEIVTDDSPFSRDSIIFFPNQGRFIVRECGKDTRYRLEQLLEFEVLENGYSVAKGGLGRAVVGGLLLGGAGAIVGAVTGGKTSKEIVTSLQLKLILKSSVDPVRYINFLSQKSKKDEIVYRTAKERITEAVALLKVMLDQEKENGAGLVSDGPMEEPGARGGSLADELMKLKTLLDQGVITKDEFERQKMRILK